MTDIQRIGEYPPKGNGVQYYCWDCKKFVEGLQHSCKAKEHIVGIGGIRIEK